jgi:hypothetical protein
MIGKFLFNWFFSRNKFAAALAHSSSGVPQSAKELYAAYRLGLYETVANSSCRDDDWRAGFARAVSLAASGRHAQADEVTRRLVAQGEPALSLAALSDALAPFAPTLAMEILDRCQAPAGLRAALLLRLDRGEGAANILHKAISAGAAAVRPELHLFLSNAEARLPDQQLACLNAFLTGSSLAPVTLRDASLPPCPVNIKPAGELAQVRGPLVSVLMTAYCAGERIESAITSLLDQTYRDIELIVVDDASTDNTADIVKAIAARDPRVVHLRLPCNVGTYVAKSIGLRHASGEFVTCHDSDDWAHPMKIERQVRPLLENRKLVCSTSQWVRMQDDGVYYARPVHPLKRMNPASPLFRKDLVLKHAGGWDPVRTGADSEFAARLKLVFGSKRVLRVAEPLTIGSHRPDSLMNAAGTGYNPAGISPTRLAYWESWGHFHIDELRAGRKPSLPVDLLAERRFPAPEAIMVARSDIETCLAACG